MHSRAGYHSVQVVVGVEEKQVAEGQQRTDRWKTSSCKGRVQEPLRQVVAAAADTMLADAAEVVVEADLNWKSVLHLVKLRAEGRVKVDQAHQLLHTHLHNSYVYAELEELDDRRHLLARSAPPSTNSTHPSPLPPIPAPTPVSTFHSSSPRHTDSRSASWPSQSPADPRRTADPWRPPPSPVHSSPSPSSASPPTCSSPVPFRPTLHPPLYSPVAR